MTIKRDEVDWEFWAEYNHIKFGEHCCLCAGYTPVEDSDLDPVAQRKVSLIRETLDDLMLKYYSAYLKKPIGKINGLYVKPLSNQLMRAVLEQQHSTLRPRYLFPELANSKPLKGRELTMARTIGLLVEVLANTSPKFRHKNGSVNLGKVEDKTGVLGYLDNQLRTREGIKNGGTKKLSVRTLEPYIRRGAKEFKGKQV